MNVRFPRFNQNLAETTHRYYWTHHAFVLAILRHNRCNIEFDPSILCLDSRRTDIEVWLDDHYVLFDGSDYLDSLDDQRIAQFDAVFKFHYSKDLHERQRRVFAFSPVSFYAWPQYAVLAQEICYKAHGMILNKQRPHTQNLQRRSYVQNLLRSNLDDAELDTALSPQLDFWNKINTALISICVPGARTDILDRGQLQYMAFGACTMAPRLTIDLPWGTTMEAGEHYLQCKSDWSDLLGRIEWVRKSPGACMEIGRNSKRLFQTCLTSKHLFRWICDCL